MTKTVSFAVLKRDNTFVLEMEVETECDQDELEELALNWMDAHLHKQFAAWLKDQEAMKKDSG